MGIDHIKYLIAHTHQARLAMTDAKAAYQEAQSQWESEHTDLITAMIDRKAEQQECEDALRQSVLEYYGETGDRALTPGVSIKVVKEVDYKDSDALTWAFDHRLALALDRKAFEKLVIGGSVPTEIAVITEKPTATIATDLGKIVKG